MRRHSRGRLFVFEGHDDSGKSSVVRRVAQALHSKGDRVKVLSFPGRERGTLGELVYRLHHGPRRLGVTKMTALSLQAMHVAAHLDAIESQIAPALKSRYTVLLDRYWWSTWVYGRLAGISASALDRILAPELAHWRACPPVGVFLLRRPSVRDAVSLRVARAYRSMAKKEGGKLPVVLLANDRTIDALVVTIVEHICGS